ncbi:superoxide dismutase [Patescibacteria group bacterium]|nr:superoxide dismutase [Patescibacteria group bacterium]MBU1034652.1 superoxide dismutase [Patescibacteria group bacterium]MBU1629660.1 superoxide dismutase [Patescibacteria group bacterium]MBU1908312.1 superoxide dismutase [Patescibacteria group bacterium]
MKTDVKPLPFDEPQNGISENTLAIHHDKLYAGYVAKKNEIAEKLNTLSHGGDVSSANQTFSELRALKDGETFATNGVYLHEFYFDILGGDGLTVGPLVDALAEKYGSFENFINYFSACGMAARGWVVLCYDTRDAALKIYTSDSHNLGGVWGCLPIIVLDVYEHAYFIDHGSDRKTYIQYFWKNLNWKKANEFFDSAKSVKS